MPPSSGAQIGHERVRQEHEPPARAEQAGRLGDPEGGVGPEGGAELRDRQVEGCIRQRDALAGRLDQRELDPRLLHHPSGGGELGRRGIDADGPSAPKRQLGGEIGRPAPELHDVEPRDVSHRRPDVILAHAEHAPRDVLRRPRPLGMGIGELRVRLRPLGDVGGDGVSSSGSVTAIAYGPTA